MEIPDLTNAELVTLRIRVIALENLMISLLATASDQQLKLAREMAGYISPRPGFTQHPLTIHAAAHMDDLVKRALHFRGLESRLVRGAICATRPGSGYGASKTVATTTWSRRMVSRGPLKARMNKFTNAQEQARQNRKACGDSDRYGRELRYARLPVPRTRQQWNAQSFSA